MPICPHQSPVVWLLPAIGLWGSRDTKTLVRSSLNRLCAFALRIRAQQLAFASSAPILVIAPHADDETLGCGGLIAQQRSQGREVGIVYVSDGSASHRDVPRAELAGRRRAEAIAATRVLGVDVEALTFIDAPDGRLDRLDAFERSRCIGSLQTVIAQLRPEYIFTPCELDGSTEHAGVFQLLRETLSSIPNPPRVLQYPVWAWWNPLLLVPIAIRARRFHRFVFTGGGGIKLRALACYRTQLESMSPGQEPMLSQAFIQLFSHEEEFFIEA